MTAPKFHIAATSKSNLECTVCKKNIKLALSVPNSLYRNTKISKSVCFSTHSTNIRALLQKPKLAQ